jgi:hypothetical protein
MTGTKLCPDCGAELAADAPGGLCVKCLLKAGLESQVAPTQSSPRSAGGFVPPLPAELAASFPQLEVIELLGQGGMGAVYKARQPSLDRLLAVKILPEEAGLDPAFAERFIREARALARLSHPHIVMVHDFGQVDGQFYFVMEFVDGVNLRQALQARSIPPEDALAIVPQKAGSLAAGPALSAGVRRDLDRLVPVSRAVEPADRRVVVGVCRDCDDHHLARAPRESVLVRG